MLKPNFNLKLPRIKFPSFTVKIKTLLIAFGLTGAVLAGAGIWGWKKLNEEVPPIQRDPLSEPLLPSNPMVPHLEKYVPEKAAVILGANHLNDLEKSFRDSNLFKQFELYVSSAQTAAEQQYGIKRKPKAKNSSSLEGYLGNKLLLALYPKEKSGENSSQSLAVLGSQQWFSYLSNAPDVLVLAELPKSFDLEKTPLRSFLPFLQTKKGTDYMFYSFGELSFAVSTPKSKKRVLVFGSNQNRVQESLGLIYSSSRTVQSMADFAWVQSAFKHISENAIAYQLTRNDEAPRLRLRSIPTPPKNITDWSVSALSWQAGLLYTGYGHHHPNIDPQFKEIFEMGPAEFSVISLLPPGGYFQVATNSFFPQTIINNLDGSVEDFQFLKELLKLDWTLLKQELGDQAAVQVSDISKSGEKIKFDFIAVLRLRRPLKVKYFMQKALNKLAENIKTVSITNRKSETAGKMFVLNIQGGDAPYHEIFLAQRDAWLFLSSTESGLTKALRHNESPKQELKDPGLYLPLDSKGNVAVAVDFYPLIKRVLAIGFDDVVKKQPLFQALLSKQDYGQYLEPVSGIKNGWMVTAYSKEGLSYSGFFPYEDFSPEIWDQKLAVYQPHVHEFTTAQYRKSMTAAIQTAYTQIGTALFQYRMKNKQLPRNLNLIVPKFLPAIPEDPLTGSKRIVKKKDGKGGWIYDFNTGSVKINTDNPYFEGVFDPILALTQAVSQVLQKADMLVPQASEQKSSSGFSDNSPGFYQGSGFNFSGEETEKKSENRPGNFTPTYNNPNEQATKRSLKNFGLAITIYKDDKNGKIPSSLQELVPVYLSEIPKTKLNNHPDTNKVVSALDDSGGWFYNPGNGTVKVNCAHPDSKGQAMSKW